MSTSCGCDGNRNAQCCQVDQDFVSNCVTDSPEEDAELSCSAIDNVSTLQDLINAWGTNNCPQVYQDILFTSETGRLEYNPNNVSRVQAELDHMINTYLGFGFDFTEDVTSQDYNPFQETIIEACANQRVPGGCDLFLQNYCQQYTYDDISVDEALASLCGCYIESPYYDLELDDGTTLNPACQPLCHLIETTQIANTCDGTIDSCDNTVCVIDNVNVNLVDTETSTAFQQICPGCQQSGDDPCTCIIGGTDVTSTLDESGVGVNYTQYCGTNAQCYTLENSGNLVETPCPTSSDFGIPAPSYIFPIALALGVIIVVVIVILVFIASKEDNRHVDVPTMWKPESDYDKGYTSSLQFRNY